MRPCGQKYPAAETGTISLLGPIFKSPCLGKADVGNNYSGACSSEADVKVFSLEAECVF